MKMNKMYEALLFAAAVCSRISYVGALTNGIYMVSALQTVCKEHKHVVFAKISCKKMSTLLNVFALTRRILQPADRATH